jgi:hypothetical protein
MAEPTLMTDEQERILAQQLFPASMSQAPMPQAPIPQAAISAPMSAPVVTQQQAAAVQPMTANDLLAQYAAPREFQAPKNLREGVSNAFNNLVLTPIQQALFMKERPSDQLNRLRGNQARLEYATQVQNLTREGQARAIAMGVDLAKYPEQIQRAYLAKSITDPAGAFDVLSTYDQRFATDKTKNFGFRENLNPDEKARFDKMLSASQTTTNFNLGEKQASPRALDDFYKMSGEYREQYNTAMTTQDTINSMRQALDAGLQTGFGREAITTLRRAGSTLGFDVPETADAEFFIGQSTRLILPLVKQLGVNPTDKDLSFVETGSPTLEKSVEGNLLMLDALSFSNERAKILQESSLQFQMQDAQGSNLQVTNPTLFRVKYMQHMMTAQNDPKLLAARMRLKARYNQITGRGSAAQTGAGAAAANALVNGG